ncbi:MAG: POTRA domain-containing protein [Candidatus Margulisiibacteriota bacterium]
MNRALLFIILTFCFLNCQFSYGQTDDTLRGKFVKYAQDVIIAVDMQGLNALSETVIRQEANLLTRANSQLKQSKVETDLKALFALGCFQAVSVDIKEERNGIKVVYMVQENSVVREIDIQGNTIYSKAELIKPLATKIGQVLNFSVLDKDLEKINDLYLQDSYDLAKVESSVYDQESGTLFIKINEVAVEDIVVTGNEHTHDHVILREMKTQPGSIYNSLQLRKDRNKILALGLFANVLSPQLVPGKDKSRIKLSIRITEQKVNALNFGAGFSETEPWFLFVNLGFKNPFGSGQEMNLKSQFSDVKQTYSAQYYHPWLFRSPTKFNLGLWNTLAKEKLKIGNFIDQPEINVSRVGWLTKFTYPLGDDFQASLIYKSEGVKEVTANNTTDINYQNNSLAFVLAYSALGYNDQKYIISGSSVKVKGAGGTGLKFVKLGRSVF